MLFNSYEFLCVFLPLAIAIYAIADRYPTARTPVLIVLSLAFYSYWDIRFLPFMVGSILFNWLAAKVYLVTKNRAIVSCAIVVDLAVLGAFKYTNFFADSLAYLIGQSIPHLSLCAKLPLGISFFTFHHIMYPYRSPPWSRTSFFDRPLCPLHLLFSAGDFRPIARWSEVMHQFGKQAFAPGWEQRCAVGATFVIIGLLQKTLLADPLSDALDPIYAEAAIEPVIHGSAWLAPAFAFQIFF